MIAAVGVNDFRTEDVAGRAGVGKAAIYRRYASKAELVTAAVAALVSEITVPNTGSTREDLLALMRDAVAVYADPIHAGVMPSVVGAMQQQPELARAVRDGLLGSRRGASRAVLGEVVGPELERAGDRFERAAARSGASGDQVGEAVREPAPPDRPAGCVR